MNHVPKRYGSQSDAEHHNKQCQPTSFATTNTFNLNNEIFLCKLKTEIENFIRLNAIKQTIINTVANTCDNNNKDNTVTNNSIREKLHPSINRCRNPGQHVRCIQNHCQHQTHHYDNHHNKSKYYHAQLITIDAANNKIEITMHITIKTITTNTNAIVTENSRVYNHKSCGHIIQKMTTTKQNHKCGCGSVFLVKIALLMQNSRSAAIEPFTVGRAKRLILHQQSDFECLNVILSQETSFFMKFHDFSNFHPP